MSPTTTSRPATTTSPGRRLWFAADAVVTGANAVIYLAAAGLLTDLLGGSAETYRWVGAFLVAYAAVVALYARSSLATGAGWAIVAANLVWVVASLEVAVTGAFDLDTVGRGWVVAQALVVGGFALGQARVLRAGARLHA